MRNYSVDLVAHIRGGYRDMYNVFGATAADAVEKAKRIMMTRMTNWGWDIFEEEIENLGVRNEFGDKIDLSTYEEE